MKPLSEQEVKKLMDAEGLFEHWEVGKDVTYEETETEILIYPKSEHAEQYIGKGQHLGFQKK